MAERWISRGDPEWVDDDSVRNCMGCASAFSVLVRRHHCRTCGRIFCDKCSSNFLQGKRVCNQCASLVAPAQGNTSSSGSRGTPATLAQNDRPRDFIAQVGQALSGQPNSRAQRPVVPNASNETPRDMGSHAAHQRLSAEQRLARRVAGYPEGLLPHASAMDPPGRARNDAADRSRSTQQLHATGLPGPVVSPHDGYVVNPEIVEGGAHLGRQMPVGAMPVAAMPRQLHPAPNGQQRNRQNIDYTYVNVNAREEAREVREVLAPPAPTLTQRQRAQYQAHHQQINQHIPHPANQPAYVPSAQQQAPAGTAMHAYMQAQHQQEQAHRGLMQAQWQGPPGALRPAVNRGVPHWMLASEAIAGAEAERQRQVEAQRAAVGAAIATNFPTHTVCEEELTPATDVERSWRARGCVICMEGFRIGETRKTLPCFHYFHEECLDNWLQRKAECPTCKLRLDTMPNQDAALLVA